MNRRGVANAVSVPGLECVLLLLVGVVGFLFAWSPAAAQSGAPYTLHVNVRLLQVPTLVLGPRGQPVPGIDAKKFNIRLDSGPEFKPSEARLEGDDPITLAILLDLSGQESDLIKQFQRDLSSWITESFRPADRIAFFGVDCTLVQTKGYLAPDASLVQQAFDNVIHSPDVHGTKSGPACGRTVRLWNAIATVVQQSAGLPGRQVILVVTEGHNGRGSVKVTDLIDMAVPRSIAIFGLSQIEDVFEGPAQNENLSSLCQRTGGLVMLTSDGRPLDLNGFVNMLRGRYILEFSEPSTLTAGHHNINVTIDKSRAFIRVAGVSAAPYDPAAANDSMTIQGGTSKAPPMGKAREHDP